MASILAGVISYAAGIDSQTIYIRMAVMMVVFFVLGVYIRNTIYSVARQSAIIKREKKREEDLRLRKLREEKMAEVRASMIGNNLDATSTINMAVGDEKQDAFEPMDLAKAIRTKAEE
jgi:hypothetical protein